MPRNNLNPQLQSPKATSPATPSTKAVVEEPFCDEGELIEPKGCEYCEKGPNGKKRCCGRPTEAIIKCPYRCVQFDEQSDFELGSHTFFPISPSSYIIIYDETDRPIYRLKPFPIPTDGNQYVE